MVWDDWADHGRIRARLDAGADPNWGVWGSSVWGRRRPLHAAAEGGSPEVVAELAGRVDDVDAEHEGRTALWVAVYHRRPDNARVLVSAGADPWRPMMAGWSPGRLSLAGPDVGLFPGSRGGAGGLSAAEAAAAAEGARLVSALSVTPWEWWEGTGLACVAGVSAAEAGRRLQATPADRVGLAAGGRWPPAAGDSGSLEIVGATDVPGGCIVTQPWGFVPQRPAVQALLSAGTLCYGLYGNPKSGNQGSISRDGVILAWDLQPGSAAPGADAPADEILRSYLCRYHAVAYACAYAGLRPADARAVTGPPDSWLRLPARLAM